MPDSPTGRVVQRLDHGQRHPGVESPIAFAWWIAEFLQALSLAFDERYFAQIRRHYQAINPKRSELVDPPWKGDR